MEGRLRDQLFGSVVRQEVGFFDRTGTGELLQRLNADTSMVATELIGKVVSAAAIAAVFQVPGLRGQLV